MSRSYKIFLECILFVGLSANASPQKPVPIRPLNLTGEYTQKTDVSFLAVEERITCLRESSNSDSNGDPCLERTINKVNILKVIESKDEFFVQISIIGGNLHSCDFSGLMTLKDNKLVYEDAIPDEAYICKIEIEPGLRPGLKVSAGEACNLYYCGFGLTLSGTNKGFTRTGEGYEISHENAVRRINE